MDQLTKELQAFLVRIHYEPDAVSHKVLHYIEHLTHLLEVEDEEALLHYFGILDHEQLSLDEIARQRKESVEDTMSHIDECLRKLAVTPEWQMVKRFTVQSS